MAIEYYKGVSGHNNAGSLVAFALQPTSDGIQYAAHPVDGNGFRSDQGGAFIVLTWTIQYPAHFTDVHTRLGVSIYPSAEVTVRVPNRFRTFANYNGMAWQPIVKDEFTYKNRGYRTVQVTITDLVAI